VPLETYIPWSHAVLLVTVCRDAAQFFDGKLRKLVSGSVIFATLYSPTKCFVLGAVMGSHPLLTFEARFLTFVAIIRGSSSLK